jgi:hypothetical protein
MPTNNDTVRGTIETARDRAREAVKLGFQARGTTPTAAARTAGIDTMTMLDFVNGETWPRNATMGKIEAVLGWPAGTIARIAQGGESPDDAGHISTDGRVQLDARASDYNDLSDVELSEAVAVATASFLRTVREIRSGRTPA